MDITSQGREELLDSYQNGVEGVMIPVSEAQVGRLFFVITGKFTIVCLHPQLPLDLGLQEQALHSIAGEAHVHQRYGSEVLDKLVPLPLQGRE